MSRSREPSRSSRATWRRPRRAKCWVLCAACGAKCYVLRAVLSATCRAVCHERRAVVACDVKTSPVCPALDRPPALRTSHRTEHRARRTAHRTSHRTKHRARRTAHRTSHVARRSSTQHVPHAAAESLAFFRRAPDAFRHRRRRGRSRKRHRCRGAARRRDRRSPSNKTAPARATSR